MKILIVLPIKEKGDAFISEAQVYLKRLRPPFLAELQFCEQKNLAHIKDPALRMDKEADVLLKKTAGYYRIALTESGAQYNSKTFSSHLKRRLECTDKIAFIIGGAFGLAPSLLAQCQEQLSLSEMTMPHRMAVAFLAEQIFRASEISRGSPYHK